MRRRRRRRSKQGGILVAKFFKVAHDRGVGRDNLPCLHSCSSTANALQKWFCLGFRALTQDEYFSNRASFSPKDQGTNKEAVGSPIHHVELDQWLPFCSMTSVCAPRSRSVSRMTSAL